MPRPAPEQAPQADPPPRRRDRTGVARSRICRLRRLSVPEPPPPVPPAPVAEPEPQVAEAYGIRFLCGADDIERVVTEVRRRGKWARRLRGQEVSSASAALRC